MNVKRFVKPVAAAAAALAVSALVFGHQDDPKERDKQPRYEGPGYRAGEDAGRGAPLGFSSANVILQSWITIGEFGPHSSANDCWGYVSPSGREYAIIGLSGGTGFVEITDPANPQILRVLNGPTSTWRDIKTYGQYAYAVSEGGSGIQVFDLSNIDSGQVALANTVTTGGTTSTHNVAIDTDSGYLYRCGGGSNGLRIYSLADPVNPQYLSSWPDRYVHDAQVVTIDDNGTPREIAICCSGFNGGSVETGIDILDVTNKQSIVPLARYSYSSNARYSHQAWLSPDNRYLYLNDELDEGSTVALSTMYVLDLNDLQNPTTVNAVTNSSTAVTHNMYTKDDLVFAANYRSGLRVFDATDPADPVEVAFFDTYPDDDNANFNSLWSNYPYFPSGTVIGSDMEKGLFVWQLSLNQLDIGFPNGAPDMLAPDGAEIVVNVSELEGTLDPNSVRMVYDTGAGFQEQVLTLARGSSEFSGTLPPIPCGTNLKFYVEAQTTDGVPVRDPASAPGNTYSALVAYGSTTIVSEDFNTDTGWTTSFNGATSGFWQRGVPVNDPAWQYAPDSDSDGSGMCWLTHNVVGNTDVDNGSVTLMSPGLDLSSGTVAISYDYYLRMTAPGPDRLLVELSDGPNGPWVQVALHDQDSAGSDDSDGGTPSQWRTHHIDAPTLAGSGVNLSTDNYLRFTANDSDPQSIVEVGLDAFRIEQIDCDPPTTLGDLDGNGVVDTFDLFALLNAWGGCDGPCPPSCAADLDDNCVVDVFDLFILLGNWG